MDTITHIVLGACIGEVVAGKQLGKKAMILGAFAQSIPDFDFVASFWLPVCQDLLAHRGFTHSLLFLLLVSPILGYASTKIFRKAEISYKHWTFFWAIQIFVHLFIDSFNAYGTGLLVPFVSTRFSFNALFVADPFFSIWPGIASVVLIVLSAKSVIRKIWAWWAIGLCSAYLLSALCIKWHINDEVEKSLSDQRIPYSKYFSTPTPMNDLLWYAVAGSDSGFYTGYKSIFDHDRSVQWRFVRRNDSLLRAYEGQSDLALLKTFSRGYYTADLWHDTLVFNDLCFGEIVGWCEKDPRFVCHYFLQYPDNNKLIVQRGRFARWDQRTFSLFIRRIAGHQ